MIIQKKLSTPYQTYRIIHQKLWNQSFTVTPGVCNNKISLQHLIHYPSAQAVAHHLIKIK